MSQSIRFVSAGAGSGKTYRVTEELQDLLASGDVQPGGVIATTFTRMAANELRERVRQKLTSNAHTELAAQMGQALINTVNGVCGQLLLRFAFEAGLSPEQKVLEEEQATRLFSVALEGLLASQPERITRLNDMAHRLAIVDDNYQPNWRGEIMEVASAARSNNMQPGQLRAWAKTSADELLQQFAQPYDSNRDLSTELQEALKTAITAIDTELDTTKTTANYLKLLNFMQVELRRGRMQWSSWVKLSKAKPGAKSAKLAEPVQMIAGDFEKNAGLHSDITKFCAEVFDLAADSLDAYQQIKAQQGMLDFVDQERLLYELLDHPHVKNTLSEELQVLFVDEFQDTSPIQLALFMRLAALADRVVWVGDIKQAIYGFRGSDPKLMQAVLRGVVDRGGVTDVLRYSWRSRPALVNYVNEVFVPTFADTLNAKQVELEAKREEQIDRTAVASWVLSGKNYDLRAVNLAFGIQQLVDSQYQVTDKESEDLRPVEYGDIAVLCRTHNRLLGIAGACAAAGIPVAFKRPGLLQTPEGALALACLRRLADRRDTLASAEIRTLVTSESPESWLAERIAYLNNEEEHWKWGETGDTAIPALQALADVRPQLSLLTPSEACELALVKGGVREAAIAWGPTANHTRHRLRNIDLLLEYAADYEDQCDMLKISATVPGLIIWLNDLAHRGEDWQAQASDGRAVSLITHHGAKGLEWPVVIAVDLDAPIRPRIWGLTVLQREEGFDINEPLAGRRLRYWPWPFGRQSTGIAVSDRINSSQVGVDAQQSVIEEIRRLLYVSFTRARDLLVLPMNTKTSADGWLSTLAVDWVIPTGDKMTLPSGATVPTQHLELTAPDGWKVAQQPYEARWVTPEDTSTEFIERNLSPSGAEPRVGWVAGETLEIGERVLLDGVKDVTALGQVVHSIIAAQINAPHSDSADRAERIIREWGFGEAVSATTVLEAATRFIAWADAMFQPTAWHVEYPVTHVIETGQVVRGFIDLLLETDDGWVIIDHKATPRPRAEWQTIAENYSGQLAMYKSAVESVSGRQVAGTWIHFPVGGGAVPVALS